MAARRLAISDLLCDEPNGSSQNTTPRHPVEQPQPSTRSLPSHLANILNDTPGDLAVEDNRSDVSLKAATSPASVRDVVPLSLQPVQLRRHTPSPSLRRDATPGGHTGLHAVQTHLGYDRLIHNEASRSAGALSRSPGHDRILVGRQQHSQVDSPHQSYSTRPHDFIVSATHAIARPSSSRSTHSDSPTAQSFSHSFTYHPHTHSPSMSHSPSSVYSLPLPMRHPSHSPALSARPVTASPVSYLHPPPAQTPSYSSPHTHYDPVRSSLRGPAVLGHSSPSMLPSGSPPSSLLPMSESRTSPLSHGSPGELEARTSAASLPSILNSPSPSLRANVGLGGLEALVQAATEERRRLSGELGPSLSRMESSPKLSRSPVMERASVQSPVSPRVHTKPLSPLTVRTSSGGRKDILNDEVSEASPHPRDSDGEPPRKRRKSSDAHTSYPSPVAIQRPIAPPRDVVAPASTSQATEAPSPAEPKIGSAVHDVLCPATIPVAPHEGGSSMRDIAVSPVVSPKLDVETAEEQAIVAASGSTAHTGERDNGSEKAEKAKEKKRREQKTREKRADEENCGASTFTREIESDARDQDAHEWLLEHYASASPQVEPAPASNDKRASGSSIAAAPALATSRGGQLEDGHHGRHYPYDSDVARSSNATKARSRTPTPLAMLEAELDGALPAGNIAASSTEDDFMLDLASPAVASSAGGLIDDNDMDVDNELLSLVDDVPSMPHVSRLKPTIATKSDVHARTKSSQASSERGSMPPPASPVKDMGNVHPGKAGDNSGAASAIAGHKKKDASQKPVPKPKIPLKPKTKATATMTTSNAKSKASKDANAAAPSPTPWMITPSTSPSYLKGKNKKSATAFIANPVAKRSVSAAGGQSRSRSTSVMPAAHVTEGEGKLTGETADAGEVNDQTQDDKLYCICKTQYDEDRAMIACDRCDEWYHTQCVNMPDLEIDLVDQFICPICVKNNPHLRLQTTYKRRCFNGLKHPNPSSPGACHRPARGTYSKYCSDECGIVYMQACIRVWRGDKDSLWESVKEARKREGVVVLVKDATDNSANAEGNGYPSPSNSMEPILEVVKPSRPKIEREKERLNGLLDKISCRRDEIKKDMDVVLWRGKLVELAVARAEQLDECGWDQRLCFGEEEHAEFGTSVLESYEEVEPSAGDATQIDSAPTEESEWWCRGQKKCARHVGWQKLRLTEVDCDKEALDAVLLKLTAQEREIRKRIEDVMHPAARSSITEPMGSHTALPSVTNGHIKSKVIGDAAKKGKKKKT